MKKAFKATFLCIVIFLLYMPIIMLAVYSFTDSTNIGAIHGFSFKNYRTLFTS